MKRRKEMQNNGNNSPNITSHLLQRTSSNAVNLNENYGNDKQSAFEYVENYTDEKNVTTEQQKYSLKSFNSSPDLAQYSNNINNIETLTNKISNSKEIEKNEIESNYFQISTNRFLRPKTPPPPPPQNKILTNETLKPTKNELNSSIYASTSASQHNKNNLEMKNLKNDDNNNFIHKDVQNQQQIPEDSIKPTINLKNSQPPPPPPLPPLNFLKSATVVKNQSNIDIKKYIVEKESPKNLKTQDCRGISAEALLSVKLKSVSSNFQNETNAKLNFSKANSTNLQQQSNTVKNPINFDLDLRSALAKRLSKVSADNESFECFNNDVLKKKNNNIPKNEKPVQKNLNKCDLSTKGSGNIANIIR